MRFTTYPLTENDAAVSQLCEEQQPAEGAQFAASLCTVRAMADYPMYTQGMAASKSPVAMKRRSWEQNRLCEEWLSENKKINEQNIDGLIFVNKLFEDTLCRMATTSLNDNIGHRVNVVKILIVKIFFHSTFSFVLGDCLKLCLISSVVHEFMSCHLVGHNTCF